MDLDPFRRFAALKDAYKAADAEKKRLKTEMDNLQEVLIGAMVEDGVSKLPIEVEGVGSVLLYPRTTLWAGPKDGDAVGLAEALKANGMGDLVKETVNRSSLSSVVREARKEDGEPLPAAVEAVIETKDRTELAMRKQ